MKSDERIKRRIDERTDFGRQTDFIDFYPDFVGASASPPVSFSLTLDAMPNETNAIYMLTQHCRCMDDAIRRNKKQKKLLLDSNRNRRELFGDYFGRMALNRKKTITNAKLPVVFVVRTSARTPPPNANCIGLRTVRYLCARMHYRTIASLSRRYTLESNQMDAARDGVMPKYRNDLKRILLCDAAATSFRIEWRRYAQNANGHRIN